MAIEAQWMQNGSYSGREDRQLLAAMWDEGILGVVGLKVSQHSPSADMSVDVSVGKAVVAGDDQPNQGNYLVSSDTVVTVPINPAPGSNSRYDRIILQVRDPDAGGPAGDDAIITVVTGTAAASPSIPALPASAISLGVIGPIGVGKTTIVTADIEDDRVFAGLRDSPGVLKPYTGPVNRIPNGWLLADGSAVSRTLYPDLNALYAEDGYPFGDGNGSTTFNLPDLQDRQPMPMGLLETVQGNTGGSDTVTLLEGMLPTHQHTMAHTHTTPNHTHPLDHDHGSFTSGADGGHSHEVVTADGGEQPFYEASSYGSGTRNGFNFVAPGGSAGNRAITDTEANHTHTVNPPAFTGTTASTGGGTTGASSAASTGPVGDGDPFSPLDPYVSVTGYIVRT